MPEEEDEIQKKENLLKLITDGCALTKRQLEVFILLARGKTNMEVAGMLHISHYTVKIHRNNIYKRLNVNSKFALGKLAEKMGLV